MLKPIKQNNKNENLKTIKINKQLKFSLCVECLICS